MDKGGTVALVQIREDPGYQELLSACQGVHAGMRRAYDALIQGYWQLGLLIRQFEDDGRIQRRYRDGTISCLAKDLGMDNTSVYRAVRFAIVCPTQDEFKRVKSECEDAGHTWSWTYVRSHVLPDPSKRPELYGGKAKVADKLMSEVEHLASRAEELRAMLRDEAIPVDKRREMAGVVLATSQVIQDVVSEQHPRDLPAATMSDKSDYLRYIRGLACIICDATPVDAAHIEAGGVGMKDNDLVTLPLCRKHHNDLHQRGRDTFQQWHGVNLYKEVVRCLVRYLEMCFSVEEERDES